MKKTTWIIIGLSICVVLLATALGVILLQKKTETIIVREPDPYTSSFMYVKPWQKFSLAPRPLKDIYTNGIDIHYYTVGPHLTVYHVNQDYVRGKY